MSLNAPESAEIPRIAVAASLVIEDRKLLVVYNIKKGVRMEPPGGKVDPEKDASPADAARREPKEELGIDLDVGHLLGVYSGSSPEGIVDVHSFLATRRSGEVQDGLEPGKIGGHDWLTWDELQTKMDIMVPSLKAALKDLEPYLKR